MLQSRASEGNTGNYKHICLENPESPERSIQHHALLRLTRRLKIRTAFDVLIRHPDATLQTTEDVPACHIDLFRSWKQLARLRLPTIIVLRLVEPLPCLAWSRDGTWYQGLSSTTLLRLLKRMWPPSKVTTPAGRKITYIYEAQGLWPGRGRFRLLKPKTSVLRSSSTSPSQKVLRVSPQVSLGGCPAIHAMYILDRWPNIDGPHSEIHFRDHISLH
jgi:hypothetical protein